MGQDTGNFGFGGEQRSYSFNFEHADKIPNSLVAVRCPEMKCEQVWIQNDPNSSGNITIGGDRLAVTGTGIVLIPGATTGWIPVNNLNKLWHLDAADSTLNYMIIR
jgi:hypothetical protein